MIRTLNVFVRISCPMHVCNGRLATVLRRLQKRHLAVGLNLDLKPVWIRTCRFQTMFQEHTQSEQVDSVRPGTVVLRMLQCIGINGQQVDGAVGWIAVLLYQDLLKQLPAAFGTAGHLCAAPSAPRAWS